MKRLNFGILAGVLVFFIFSLSQINLAQTFTKNKKALQNSVDSQSISKQHSEEIKTLTQKVNDMEKYVNESHKYVESSQKNLDLWLKYLAFTLSVLIGYSIFNGLKSRDLAKEELAEIRRIKEDIKRVTNDAEDRLKSVKEQILEIETTAASAKTIENKMTEQLNEIGSKAGVTLDEKQKKIIEDSINKAQEDLQKSGIEAFKNLYLAKSLKAQDDKKWEEVIRLTNAYLDLDDVNSTVYARRGFAYYKLNETKPDNSAWENAMLNCQEVLKLTPEETWAHGTIGVLYVLRKDYTKAIESLTQAISLSKNDRGRGYFHFQRAKVYKEMGNEEEEEKDKITAYKLFPDVQKFFEETL